MSEVFLNPNPQIPEATHPLRLYRGGRIASSDRRDPELADVLVDGTNIQAVEPDLPVPSQAEVIDCAGQILLPALYDLHAHGREPGQEGKETIRTVSEAAINGGITGLLLMPNTLPAVDHGNLVETILEKARNCRIPIRTAGCITKGRQGEELASIAGMERAGVAMLTDSGVPVENPQLLRRAMEYARSFGLFTASHCDTPALSGGGVMHEGRVSYSLGLPGMPAISEEVCMARDIRLAQYTETHVHIQQVSTAEGVQTIARYKDMGVQVTAEVSPHHLIFNHGDIRDYDTNLKMNPPLRTPEDNEALLQGLRDGVIDALASDHAPHTEFEKNNDFVSAPFGITGLETALVSLYHYGIKPGKLSWEVLIRSYSEAPRILMGLSPISLRPGQPAEFLVFDPERPTCFTREFMQSKAANTPFLNRELEGQVREVVRNGEVLLRR